MDKIKNMCIICKFSDFVVRSLLSAGGQNVMMMFMHKTVFLKEILLGDGGCNITHF